MGSKGGSSGGETTTTIRYPPYVEAAHQDHLTQVQTYVDALKDSSPYSTFTSIDTVEDAFFGAGYAIDSFPSMWDMYGKFIAGLDIEVLWDQAYDAIMDSTITENLVDAESDLLDDQVVEELARYKVGMRDINSVVASTFVVGKSLIEDGRTKAVAKFSAELKYRLLPIVTDRWQRHLEWNKDTIKIFAELMKQYYMTKMDVDNHNYGLEVKDTLWPFTVMHYQGAALGAIQGASTTKSEADTGGSKAGGFLSGALTGAAAGAYVGSVVPGIGTAIGAIGGGVIGGIAGLFR